MYYKEVSSILVDCSDLGFGDFEVLIVPSIDTYESRFYLLHKHYRVVVDMFSTEPESTEYAIELAHACVPDYIPQFLKECFPDKE